MNKQTVHAILSIAGSDPSGGAGIQADIKTISALGGYAAAAITCLTIQNTTGVLSYHQVSPETVHQQIKAVLDDLTVSHIKIGMLGSAEIAEAVALAVAEFEGEIILDPIFSSSCGQRLMSHNQQGIVPKNLLNKVTVLTPNRYELQLICGISSLSTEEALLQAANLFPQNPNLQAVILKGGHFNEQSPTVTDFLILADSLSPLQPVESSHPRVNSANTHGTGCTLSSAFAFFHQQTGCYKKSFKQSSQFVNNLLQASTPFIIGNGTGGMLHHLLSCPPFSSIYFRNH